MYNPYFRHMIAQDNGEMAPIIDTHLFEAIVTIGLFVITLAAFSIEIYRVGIVILEIAGEYLWNLLAQEVEWINIAFISFSIFTGGMTFLIMSEISKKLDTAFTQLKTEIKEKDVHIAELEAELKALNHQIMQNLKMDENTPEEQKEQKKQEEEEKVSGEQKEEEKDNVEN